MNDNIIIIEDFAKRNFIKSFEKKYKNHWEVSFEAFKEILIRIDRFVENNKDRVIIDNNDIKIIKLDIRIFGTKDSARASGNRVIVAWYVNKKEVKILLVYSKNDISTKNETVEWKKIIKDNYKDYNGIINI